MQSSIYKRYADTPAGQVHLLERPGADLPVVLLHQTASSSNTYEEILQAGVGDHRLIAVDTPGFGGSFDPPGLPAMEDYAVQVVAALDALSIPRFHLFGHHTGASLGAEIAVHWPERAASLTLLGPVLMSPDEREQFRDAYQTPFTPTADGAHLLANWRYASQHNADCDPLILHREVLNMARAWQGRAQAYSAVSWQDGEDLLRRVACPILLMSSETDFFHAQFDRATSLRPDAAVAMVDGGNFAPMLGAASITAALARFLDGLGQA
jgi:pimeloyl-ACP methyl ester carboxylesterase